MRLLIVGFFALLGTACGSECNTGETACDGMKIITCGDDGTFGEPTMCMGEGEMCMTMESGSRCMVPEE